MSEEEERLSAEGEEQVRMGAAMLVTTLTLRMLIADLASRNKSPEQANEYVANIKSNIERFIDLNEDIGGKYTKVITREMQNHANKLLSGIKFESN